MSTPTTKPTKEQVRSYMSQRQTATTPPLSPEEIRRQLGWGFVPDRSR